MKLIVDEFTGRSEIKNVIVESNLGKEKKYYIEGVFAQSEVKNRNGRMYPKAHMESAINSYMDIVNDRRAIGELNHPNSPTPNPERASHIIESLKWESNDVIGKARVLTSLPMGQIVKGLIDEDVKIGVSTRGLGSVTMREGVNVVDSDFIITAVDVVADPSAPSAFVRGIMEGAEWVYEASSGSWILAEQFKNKYKKLNTKQITEAQVRDFQNFLNSLR